jgi:hypothetical protein
VVKAISDLKEHERTAVTLFYIDGYTQREVGEFLEVPEKTVKSRLYSARLNLKERMMDMVDKTMKKSSLPDDFASTVVRLVSSQDDLDGVKRILGESYHAKQAPDWFKSVQSARDANIYVVSDAGVAESAGFYGEMDWSIGETRITAVRPLEMAHEAFGVPDPVFVKGFSGCFRMARERGRSLAVLHGSMFDHGFCGLIPSFYYCCATLPIHVVRELAVAIETHIVCDEEGLRNGQDALLRDPYATKLSAFLGGGDLRVLQRDGETLGYYRTNPDVFEKARKAGMRKPFGYVNSITVQSRDAAIAVLVHAASMAEEAGEDEIRILESHETLITKTILGLGGSYLMRPSCPLVGLDAEMVGILDFERLTVELADEFRRRLGVTDMRSPAKLSLEMSGKTVGFVWDGDVLAIDDAAQKAHLVLPRWAMTRLYTGYYSGADILSMRRISPDIDYANVLEYADESAADSSAYNALLPVYEAMMFRSLFPKLWPCSMPDPDVWPWVTGDPHPAYQHEADKTTEMKARIDNLQFPWIGC